MSGQSGNVAHQRFRDTVESAYGPETASPLSRLLSGKIDRSRILECLRQSTALPAQDKRWLGEVRSWLTRHVDPEEIENKQAIPDDYLPELRAMGCLSARIPQQYSGGGKSQQCFSRVLVLIASRSEVLALVTSVQQLGVAQGLLSLQKLERDRSPAEREHGERLRMKYLRGLSQDRIGAFCLTTPETGSDPGRLQTIARQSADGKAYLLEGDWRSGGKLYTTLGTIADVYIMLAIVLYPGESVEDIEPRKRITAFIVDRDLPGISLKPLSFCGWKGLPNAAIKLDQVRVPAGNRVGRVGDGLRIAFMNLASGRINISAICLGMMKQLETVARSWSAERVQGGKPIGYHQLNTLELIKMNASVFALESCVQYTSALADQSPADFRLEAAIVKLFASMTVIETADATLQLRGGRGYETYASQVLRGEHGAAVERLYRSARLMSIGEGGSNVLMLYVMRCLLGEVFVDYKRLGSPDVLLIGRIRILLRLVAQGLKAMFPRVLRTYRSGCVGLDTHFQYLNRAQARFSRALYGRIVFEGLSHGCYTLKRAFCRVVYGRGVPACDKGSLSGIQAVSGPAESLEQNQVLLGHYSMIATYLSVMTICCLNAQLKADQECVELADEFCRIARGKIAVHYLQIRQNTRSVEHKRIVRGHKILHGGYAYLTEQGIVEPWCAEPPGPAGEEAGPQS